MLNYSTQSSFSKQIKFSRESNFLISLAYIISCSDDFAFFQLQRCYKNDFIRTQSGMEKSVQWRRAKELCFLD